MLRLARWSTALLSFIAMSTLRAQPVPSDVAFTGTGGLELKGTLLLPEKANSADKFPAVLLLPGSGPTDRDGNQLPYMRTDLLKQIAERLAADGFATFRFDKRAAPMYAQAWPKTPKEIDAFFAFEHFTADAAAAFDTLRSRPEIDAERVAILGHSEGGLIALSIAAERAEGVARPAGLVLAGTAGRVLDVVLREQLSDLLKKQGADEATSKMYMDFVDRSIAAVESGEPLPEGLPAGLKPLFNATVMTLLKSYFTIDPAELAGRVRGPVLVLQGEHDSQISAARDAPLLQKALATRKGEVVRLLIVPGTSHNLKDAPTIESQGIAGPVAPEALDALSAWCRGHLQR